jgi:type I restriction enzyme S subunit
MARLKPGWQRVKFGEIAECANDRVDDPAKAGVDRYVGLEHLDPDSLAIRRWGTPNDVESTKLRFRPGDIIFGKRRAYQRKLAVASFEGICSAHAMVLRAKPGAVESEFLPFFMQSDAFMERAQSISVGSLSPTINWKTLAAQEFALPPRDEQGGISMVLVAAAQLVDSSRTLVEQSKRTLRSQLLHQLSSGASRWPAVPLEAAVDRFIDYRGRTPQKTETGIPLITAKNVRDGYLDFSDPEWIEPGSYDAWMTRGLPKEGDVLFTTEAPLGMVARAPAGRFALAQRIICLQSAPTLAPGFLFWAMRGGGVQAEIRKRSTGTTVAGIKQSVLRQVTMVLPPRRDQESIVEALESTSSAAKMAEARLHDVQHLWSSLRKSMLGVAL